MTFPAGFLLGLAALLSGQTPGVASTDWMDATTYEYFHVVVPPNASPAMMDAARTFQTCWKISTRRDIKISERNEGRYNVWLGAEVLTEDLLGPEEKKKIPAGGCLVRTYIPPAKYAARGANRQLIIAANDDQGVMRGIHVFFQKMVGARWLAPDAVLVPYARFSMPKLDVMMRPPFAFRENSFLGLWGRDTLAYRRGMMLDDQFAPPPPGMEYLLPLASPTPSPPVSGQAAEYGSEAGAAALAETLTQLISAGQDGDGETLARREKAAWPPGSGIWSLSAMDWLTPVLSPDGVALNMREESPSAAVIFTANRVAQLLAGRFPGNPPRVHVLLPPELRRPPKSLRPDPAVIVHLSRADADFSLPPDDPGATSNAVFGGDVSGWNRLGAELYVLDFLCNRRDPSLPFPCLDAIQPSVLYYIQHNVAGVYMMCGTGGAPPESVDLGVLRSYLFGVFSWDPDLVMDMTTREFCRLYYGPAADAVQEYCRIASEARKKAGVRLGLDDDAAWFDADSLNRAIALFDGIPDDAEGFPAYKKRALAACAPLKALAEKRKAP